MDPILSLDEVRRVHCTFVVGARELVPRGARKLSPEEARRKKQACHEPGEKVINNIRRVHVGGLFHGLAREFLLAEMYYEEQEKFLVTLDFRREANLWWGIGEVDKLAAITVGYVDGYENADHSIGFSFKAVQPGLRAERALLVRDSRIISEAISTQETIS